MLWFPKKTLDLLLSPMAFAFDLGDWTDEDIDKYIAEMFL